MIGICNFVNIPSISMRVESYVPLLLVHAIVFIFILIYYGVRMRRNDYNVMKPEHSVTAEWLRERQ